MSIFKWLLGTQTKNSTSSHIKQIKSQVDDRIAFFQRVNAFTKNILQHDAIKFRDKTDLNPEDIAVFAKTWDELWQEWEEFKNEFVKRKHTGNLDDAERKMFRAGFQSDNPYLLRQAVENTRNAILASWPKSALRSECIDLIEKNFTILSKAFRDAVVLDKYGNPKEDKQLLKLIRDSPELFEYVTIEEDAERKGELREFLWSHNLVSRLENFSRKYFYTNKYSEQLNKHFFQTEFIQQNDLFEYVVKKIEKMDEENRSKGFDPKAYPEDGIEFEKWVSDQLIEFGWSARVTQSSADQGVDIISELNGLSVAIQCKRYSHPVGNKAVQEITAGMQHYMTDYGVVITTSTFTKSALQLAKTTQVKLLHVQDIPNLFSILTE